ncbi:energy-coupling factor transport system ATP-binding protein [Microbacterium resistens]|uniref:Energy-coupling factor transport system ATP-binding protein n=1 Tax=Microbacterium resistens TaxID=156977 RepID=A0ABU1SA79_9MICO|nr:ATP-binding cassette domain-containing protein [Microbacterium resistens]MDR6866519.1 energy-coupling factor transport system ATP-binding protein [Microbacterium resistens]
MPSSAPLIRVRDLSLTHAGASDPSPHGVSFDVHPGEVLLLLGPSGSGKSTLTLALNGLIPHSVDAELSGSVEVAGRDTRATPVASLSTTVAMVFQDPDAQLVTGTVLDEVAFGPENLLLPVDEVLRRTEAALRRVGLWERRAENPDRLSGGGRQRLAIACALAMGSPVIVLDEPTANLDPQGIEDVHAALRELAEGGEHAIILVEHNLDAAMAYATRAIVLDQSGGLAFDGPLPDLIRDRVDELAAMGVWLPAATVAALRLRAAGLPIDPLPVTPDELRDAVSRQGGHPLLSGERPTAPGDTHDPGDRDTAALTGEPIIRIRGLDVVRGRVPVLHGIDLDIAAGGLTAVIGANGAGKTTLVQAIAGVVPPPRRRVSVDGIDPGRASPRELTARIGFVFQNPEHQFLAHTVFDELAHGLRLRRLPEDEIRPRVEEMLDRFGLTKKADSHPFLLSGGEKRRLSVGTALIARPGILALDEPTFGQDRARAAELVSLLRELRAEGTTILIVTHDLQLVADDATSTVILAAGRLHAAGATEDLLGDDGIFESAGLRLPAVTRALPPRIRPLLAAPASHAGTRTGTRTGTGTNRWTGAGR